MNDPGSGPIFFEVTRTESPRGYRLEGELDYSTAPSLLKALDPDLRSGGDLRLDLSDLRFMDSVGLQTILKLARDLQSKGNVILIHPGNLVRSLLELGIGMNKIPNLEVIDEGPEQSAD
jgi:anti-anti-sigma factor